MRARWNARKQGVEFADAVAALEDERALTMRDASSDEEERRVTPGMDTPARLWVVANTRRGERAGLISAGKAAAGERGRYGETDET